LSDPGGSVPGVTLALLILCLACLSAGLAVGWLLADRRATAARATLAAERSLVDDRLAGLSAQALAPLQQTLARVDAQLRETDRERVASLAGLRTQVAEVQRGNEALRGETAALVTALRAPPTRGRWGETQLRRVLEAAGALEHCDFVTQASARDDEGALLRPDVVVRLAGGKSLVIDAKVPLSAHLEAVEARDDVTRADRERAHARQLRSHIGQLAARAYWQQVAPSPEFVVLFLPSDAVLDAALRVDPTLQEQAFTSNVVLATPSTLVALVRTVAYTWRTDALSRNAAEVSALGRELHLRLATLGGHVAALGRALDGAVGAFNKTVGSLESRVLVSARRLAELGVAGDELPSPDPVLLAARQPAAPELVADPEVDALLRAEEERSRAAPRASPGWLPDRGEEQGRAS